MENFELHLDESKTCPVFNIKGYYSEESGIKVNEMATNLLRKGKLRLVIDFTECFAINSPGIASLMDLALIVSDDFKGKLILSGLNAMNSKVLTVAGVIPFIDSAPTIPDAIKKIEPR